MEVSKNRQAIDTWCSRVWGERDQSAIHELFPQTGTAVGIGHGTMAGPDDFAPFHQAMCAMLTDTCMRIDHAIEKGDEVFALATFSGKCAETGTPVEMEGSMAFRLADGTIQHCSNHFEFIGLFEQLGLLPQDSFGMLLQKQKLTCA